jgi:hypothetical protein
MYLCIEDYDHPICLLKNWNMAIGSSCHPTFSLQAIKEYNYAGCTAPSGTSPFHSSTDTYPTPLPAPTSSAAATTLHCDAKMLETGPIEKVLDNKEEPMECYHIDVPPPLPGTASWKALKAENMMLQDIIVQAGITLEEDYAQMKLMDLENKRLRK